MTQPTYRALTVRQPHAWAIIHGGKDVENRGWETDYRGPLLIHAAKKTDGPLADRHADVPRQAIIGVVELVDIVRDSDSRWAHAGARHWVLEDPRALDPIPCRGFQHLWSPTGATSRVLRDALKSLDSQSKR